MPMITPQYTICEIIRECLSTIDEKSEKEIYFQKPQQPILPAKDCFTLEDGSGLLLLEDGTQLLSETYG